jgi:urease gamma subunit
VPVQSGIGAPDTDPSGNVTVMLVGHTRPPKKSLGGTVNLTPADTEKLLLAVAGMVARDRLDRGVKLNYPESVALLSNWVLERAREGHGVEDLMANGREVLTRHQVMDGVAEMLLDVQVEATFPDGRKLVTLHHPIA